jgi:hypothetical protein
MQKNTQTNGVMRKNWAILINNHKNMDSVNKKAIYKPQNMCYTHSIISDVYGRKRRKLRLSFVRVFSA